MPDITNNMTQYVKNVMCFTKKESLMVTIDLNGTINIGKEWIFNNH